VATPARADTGAGAPKLLRKEPLCPSASAKSTPVKSPEKKRTKTDDAGDEQPPLVQKSLMVELEKAAAEPADSVSWIYMEFSKRVAQIYSKLIRRSPVQYGLKTFNSGCSQSRNHVAITFCSTRHLPNSSLDSCMFA